jgi:hypothetical protein
MAVFKAAKLAIPSLFWSVLFSSISALRSL